MKTKQFKEFSIETIMKAKSGDMETLYSILDYFNGYIKKLSTQVLKDEYDNTYLYIDNDIRSRLEVILISRIINDFKILTA